MLKVDDGRKLSEGSPLRPIKYPISAKAEFSRFGFCGSGLCEKIYGFEGILEAVCQLYLEF
jgi:hypothetical protein